jgi:hypothetical protein
MNTHGDNIGLDETEYRTVRSVTGTKQTQSKMMLDSSPLMHLAPRSEDNDRHNRQVGQSTSFL